MSNTIRGALSFALAMPLAGKTQLKNLGSSGSSPNKVTAIRNDLQAARVDLTQLKNSAKDEFRQRDQHFQQRFDRRRVGCLNGIVHTYRR